MAEEANSYNTTGKYRLNKMLENISIDPQDTAVLAGLKYISDEQPGITRVRRGKGFIYLDSRGEPVTNERTIQRIKSLVIPPAWNNVWICSTANGHIQSTGRDVKGRKQYIYHPEWDEIRNQTKFFRMVNFGKALPAIRKRVDEDLDKKGFPREKILALIINLLEKTYIRVGSEEYAKNNGSYGLTTLRNKHISVEGSHIKFLFKGKSGKLWQVAYKDRRIARLVKQCQELPGYDVFRYKDEEGRLQTVDSGEVNKYIREISGDDFTAKDFRTWNGTVIAATELNLLGPAFGVTEEKRKIVQAVKKVSQELINTPSICRKYYIHPDILTSYSDGSLFKIMDKHLKKNNSSEHGLSPEEKAVLEVLENGIAAAA
jgi:DNA topoisomerase I